MHIGVVTLFPEMFAAVTDHGISGRAVKQDLVTVEHWNLATLPRINIVLLMIVSRRPRDGNES